MRTVNEWIDWAAGRLVEAGVHFGHGTDNAQDEAAWLVLHAIGAPVDGRFEGWGDTVGGTSAEAIRTLVEARIERRCPAAYLIGTAWFAGLEFEVGPDVLVPRSPIAALIEDRFEPWLAGRDIDSILDLGTGSGCIAIACALRFPGTRVIASDISDAALAVAARNVRRHRVEDRVRLVRSDVFDSLGPERYDLIVSNPPYVPAEAVSALPAEYRAEPALGLVSGLQGLELPLRILQGAESRLSDGGVLICEVGESDQSLQDALPEVPFLWLEFAAGGSGVFLLEKAQLGAAAAAATDLLRK